MWDSQQVAQLVGGELLGNPHVKASGAVIDSRQAASGEIFFALRGEKVDGRDYIEAAWSQGATLAIGEKESMGGRPELEPPPGKALILVESSLQALQQLAGVWCKELGAKVVGITGSNGKTTTKDMIAAVLAQKYRVHKNKENHNNELGLPLTVLNAPAGTEILVLEMGMRGLGQIRFLCGIVVPDIGVITNIGPTHIELLGSQENIAKAKWELIEALPTEGIAVLNAEDYWSVEKGKGDSHCQRYYGLRGAYHPADLYGTELQPAGALGTRFRAHLVGVDPKENQEGIWVELPLPGEHNVLDALAALEVGRIFQVTLAEGSEGLGGMALSKMRLEQHPGLKGSILISDVYNANPVSVQASLGVLSERGGKSTLAILGDMYELGTASEEGHYGVGKSVAELGIQQLIAVGDLAAEIARGARESGMPPENIFHCPSREEAATRAKHLLEMSEPGVWVLIKGSRGMRMEEVTSALRQG